MKAIKKVHKHLVALLLLLACATMTTSCSSDDDEPADLTPKPQIVFLFSPGGLGDMSYNDCILEGVQRFKMEHPDIDIYIYSPGELSEAEKIFSDWVKRPAGQIPVLFVLGSSDYEPMAEKYLAAKELAPNKNVLLFESSKQFDDTKIHTFRISMFGASYLAGAVAREATERDALVVLANGIDRVIGVAKDGFVAGYGKDCDIEYLADDWTGYVSATLAYQKMSEWSGKYGFIFPVAGGSNGGIYRYSREFADAPLLAGMDTDQSKLSNNITGSVMKHIDRLIYEYLTEWSATGNMPESQLYGLESGYVDWQLSPRYADRFSEIVEARRDEAINKEKEHYEADNN